jgi:hypothetical protein
MGAAVMVDARADVVLVAVHREHSNSIRKSRRCAGVVVVCDLVERHVPIFSADRCSIANNEPAAVRLAIQVTKRE